MDTIKTRGSQNPSTTRKRRAFIRAIQENGPEFIAREFAAAMREWAEKHGTPPERHDARCIAAGIEHAAEAARAIT
jgi:hypothetical protein